MASSPEGSAAAAALRRRVALGCHVTVRCACGLKSSSVRSVGWCMGQAGSSARLGVRVLVSAKWLLGSGDALVQTRLCEHWVVGRFCAHVASAKRPARIRTWGCAGQVNRLWKAASYEEAATFFREATSAAAVAAATAASDESGCVRALSVQRWRHCHPSNGARACGCCVGLRVTELGSMRQKWRQCGPLIKRGSPTLSA